MESEKLGKLVILLTSPRSLSTISCMLLSNVKNTSIYMDKLVEIVFEYMIVKYDSEEEKEKGLVAGKEKLDSILNSVENDLKKGKTVFFKDFPLHFDKPFFFEPLSKLINSYKTYFLYFVRHPIPRLISMKKTIAYETKIGIRNEDDLIKLLKEERYQTLKDSMAKNKGHCVIVESLQENPIKELQAIMDYLDINEKITEDHLMIGDLYNKENVFPYKAYYKPEDDAWYLDCLNSKNTMFKTKKVEILEGNFKEEWEIKMIEKESKIYQSIVEDYSNSNK